MSRPAKTDDAVAQHNLAQLDALPLSLPQQPLDFIFADHFRRRSLSAMLRIFARSRHVPHESADKIPAFYELSRLMKTRRGVEVS